jgi:hypothetical protein
MTIGVSHKKGRKHAVIMHLCSPSKVLVSFQLLQYPRAGWKSKSSSMSSWWIQMRPCSVCCVKIWDWALTWAKWYIPSEDLTRFGWRFGMSVVQPNLRRVRAKTASHILGSRMARPSRCLLLLPRRSAWAWM